MVVKVREWAGACRSLRAFTRRPALTRDRQLHSHCTSSEFPSLVLACVTERACPSLMPRTVYVFVSRFARPLAGIPADDAITALAESTLTEKRRAISRRVGDVPSFWILVCVAQCKFVVSWIDRVLIPSRAGMGPGHPRFTFRLFSGRKRDAVLTVHVNQDTSIKMYKNGRPGCNSYAYWPRSVGTVRFQI